MEFLYPRPEEGGKIMLLLLVAQDQNTQAVCYEWDAHDPLKQITPRVTRRLLPPEERLPTMLIPLTKTSSFMLITTKAMAVYRNGLDPRRQPTRYPLRVPDRESRRSPLWTRWARPLRNWQYNQKHDDIYLCREDGQVAYLEIGNDGEVENHTHLGQLCCDVDGAFDILDIGNEGDDLLLTAGNTGDGGLFVQKARDHPKCVQKFINWTPVTDSLVVKSQNQDSSSAEVSSDRLFICSASSFGRGAIVELRHGIEAQIGLAISLEEISSTRDIWTMPNSTDGGVFVLTSDPISSMLLYLPPDFREEGIHAIDDIDSGLDSNAQTLAAGCTEFNAMIQVTSNSIRIGTVSEGVSSSCFDSDLGQFITSAAVDGPASLIVTAVRSEHQMSLHFKKVTSSDNEFQLCDVCQPLEIQYEPVFISIQILDIGSCVLIGTGNGRLLVYRVEEGQVILLSDTHVVVDNGDDMSMAIDSIALIRPNANSLLEKLLLLCGLRSGALVPFELSWTDDAMSPGSSIGRLASCKPSDLANISPVLKQTTPQRLGHTSVKVQSHDGRALLTCGLGFWQASSCVVDGESLTCALERIWITDQNDVSSPSHIFCAILFWFLTAFFTAGLPPEQYL